MSIELPYGTGASVHLEISPDALIAFCDAPRGQALDDPQAAAAAALVEPLEFPPLSQSTVPGDKVALALDHGVPQGSAIVAAVVQTLMERGIEPEDILVLRTHADLDSGLPDPRGILPSKVRERVELATHDPQDKNQLAYMAANRKGKPILLNRRLVDADFVVPIGCLDLTALAGYHGRHGVLFPTFSDVESTERFRALDVAALSTPSLPRSRREADEAGWLLGVAFTIQVIPAGGGEILEVLSGSIDAVFKRGQARCKLAWQYQVPRAANLVIAAISNEPGGASWTHIGRAVEAASRIVEEEGAIAICSDLAIKPGRGIRRIARAHDLSAARRHISQERAPDAVPATQIALALEKSRIYFLSRLPESSIEDCGLISVSNPDDIARLATRQGSCIAMANAQHARGTLISDGIDE